MKATDIYLSQSVPVLHCRNIIVTVYVRNAKCPQGAHLNDGGFTYLYNTHIALYTYSTVLIYIMALYIIV
jgi:hypothetical protein